MASEPRKPIMSPEEFDALIDRPPLPHERQEPIPAAFADSAKSLYRLLYRQQWELQHPGRHFYSPYRHQNPLVR